MLVVSRDGVRTKNLVWKDTAIIPIAEHLGSGMMTVLHVDPAPAR